MNGIHHHGLVRIDYTLPSRNVVQWIIIGIRIVWGRTFKRLPTHPVRLQLYQVCHRVSQQLPHQVIQRYIHRILPRIFPPWDHQCHHRIIRRKQYQKVPVSHQVINQLHHQHGHHSHGGRLPHLPYMIFIKFLLLWMGWTLEGQCHSILCMGTTMEVNVLSLSIKILHQQHRPPPPSHHRHRHH